MGGIQYIQLMGAIINSRAHAQRRVIVVGLWVIRSVCPHVFSPTVAVVDAKHGYVGMC